MSGGAGARIRVWIDTDLGSDVDDALAFAYALRHPGLELVGVSTVFGDVALRSRIATKRLEIAGDRSVPVVTGLGAPLSPDRVGRMFGHEGSELLPDSEPILETRADEGADERVDALAQALESTRPDVLVAIGPLTNLGALARAGHVLPPLAVMGGRMTDAPIPGMLDAIPEWNWWCDPEAVGAVLAAKHGAPPRIVPFDVTWSTHLELADLDRLDRGDELARSLGRLSKRWLRAQRELFGASEPAVRLHDPLVLVALTRPDLVRFTEARIRVDAKGATHHEATGSGVLVAGAVDNDALRAHLVEVWT